MDYYTKLNQIIASELQDHNLQFLLDSLGEIIKLANIIIENTTIPTTQASKQIVPLNESLDNVINFFHQLNPNYATMFQNVLNDGSITFYPLLKPGQIPLYPNQHYNDQSTVDPNGTIHIDYDETLQDTYKIAHETIHKFSYKPNSNSPIKVVAGEVPTITIDLLLQDYLTESNKYSQNDIDERLKNRLMATYEDAGAITFEYYLLHLYKQNNNHVTPQILLDYLESLNKNSNLYQLFSIKGSQYLDEIVNKGHLQFPIRQRYIIGTMLASDFYSKITNDKSKITELFYLIDILRNDNTTLIKDLDSLEKLNIPIIANKNIHISPQNLDSLTKAYIQIVDKLNKSKIRITKK